MKPDWDLSGAVEDTGLLIDVGLRVADPDRAGVEAGDGVQGPTRPHAEALRPGVRAITPRGNLQPRS